MKEQVNYQNQFEGKGHDCPNLVIRCMDFRFHGQVQNLLDDLFADEGGFGAYDSPGVGGGASKAIIDEASRPVVYSAIDIARDKHHLKRIAIIDHVDCGAYGGSAKFNDPKAEEAFHIERLKEAKEVLGKDYPELEVVLLYQDWNSLKKVVE